MSIKSMKVWVPVLFGAALLVQGCGKDSKGATGRTIEGTNGGNAVTGVNIQIAGDLAGLDLDESEKVKFWGWYTYPTNSSVTPGENAAAAGTPEKSPVVQQIASYAGGSKLVNILHFTVENTPTQDTSGEIMYIGTYTYHLEIESIEGYECTLDNTSGLISDLGGVDEEQTDFTINSTCKTTYAAGAGGVKGHSGPVGLKLQDGSTVTIQPGKDLEEVVSFDLPVTQLGEFPADATKTEELKADVRKHMLASDSIATDVISSKGKGFTATVVSAPSGQSCTVTPGAQEWDSELRATSESDKVAYHRQRLSTPTQLQVVCANVSGSFSVGGTVKDLNGDLVLQLNGANDLTVSTESKEDKDFVFPAKLAGDVDYEVTVLTQPDGQSCTVSKGQGTPSGTSEKEVSIECVDDSDDPTYALSVDVSGLTSGTLKLQNNINLNKLDVTADGTHAFSQAITANDGYDYDVRILAQPAGQTCYFTGSGAATASDDATVAIHCVAAAPSTYTVGGTVSGLLPGDPVVLTLTYGSGSTQEDLTVDFDPMSDPVDFSFLAGLSSGDTYTVTIKTQPGGVTCLLTSGDSGTMGSANVTDVVIDCSSI